MRITLRLLAASLLLFSARAALASPTIESLSAASAQKFQALGGPATLKSGAVEVAVAGRRARRPVTGTIEGGANHSPVKLTIDRRAWTVEGAVNFAPVGLKVDHENRTITGGANNSPVSLTFTWTPGRMVLQGHANQSPVELVVDFNKGTLMGHSNYGPVKLEYDKETGEIKGYANRQSVGLRYDKVSGELKGGINLLPVGLTLTNATIGDFLQYFFLFLKPAGM